MQIDVCNWEHHSHCTLHCMTWIISLRNISTLSNVCLPILDYFQLASNFQTSCVIRNMDTSRPRVQGQRVWKLEDTTTSFDVLAHYCMIERPSLNMKQSRTTNSSKHKEESNLPVPRPHVGLPPLCSFPCVSPEPFQYVLHIESHVSSLWEPSDSQHILEKLHSNNYRPKPEVGRKCHHTPVSIQSVACGKQGHCQKASKVDSTIQVWKYPSWVSHDLSLSRMGEAPLNVIRSNREFSSAQKRWLVQTCRL